MPSTRAMGQMLAPAAPAPAVPLSRQEADLVVRLSESIVAFAHGRPLEFHAYCPPDRWDARLRSVAAMVSSVERQISEGRASVVVPGDGIVALMDLEECVSGAKDKALSASRLSLLISSAGAVGWLVGLPWLWIASYVASLAVSFGPPALEYLKSRGVDLPFRLGSAGGRCLGDHTDKSKVLERAVLSRGPAARHRWGTAAPGRSPVERAVCLARGSARVRVEGWQDDRIWPAAGWAVAPSSECEDGRPQVWTWQPCGEPPRTTAFGPLPVESGHEATVWAGYSGPFTGGLCRLAGPFG